MPQMMLISVVLPRITSYNVCYTKLLRAAPDADVLAEGADCGCRIPAPAHAGDGRHAGVIPAGNIFFIHQLQQLALAHDRIAQVQTGELV